MELLDWFLGWWVDPITPLDVLFFAAGWGISVWLRDRRRRRQEQNCQQ
jgi:hypothetical protein